MHPIHLRLLLLAAVMAVIRIILTVAPGEPDGQRRRARDGIDLIAIAITVTVLLSAYVFQVTRVEGRSMLPSLRDQELTIVNKLIYRLHSPERGDVVVFESPREEGVMYIKRVIAMPNERVEVSGGWVRVNNLRLNEPYQSAPPEGPALGPLKLPKDRIWVMGDNRPNSTDSRDFGPLDRGKILGKASFIIWPPARWGFIQAFRGKRFRS